jgi:tetratricopeptide (TPR) repeat protein
VDNLSWEEFLRQLKNILGPDFHQELRIQYVDDENDKVDITTQWEWEACLSLIPSGQLVKLYITPGSGVYFKDAPPPAPEFFYCEGEPNNTIPVTAEGMRNLAQTVPECIASCFNDQKILPYHMPSWMANAVEVKPVGRDEVQLDVNVSALFNSLFDRALSHMNNGQLNFAKQFWLKALDLNISTATVLYNLACTESLLGNKGAALKYLRSAIENGFARFQHASTDADLEFIRNEPEFRELVWSRIPVKEEPKQEEVVPKEEAPAVVIKEESQPISVEVPMEEAPIQQEPEIPAQPVEEPKEVPFANEIKTLEAMGFVRTEKMETLLVAFRGKLDEVVEQLLVNL